MIDRSVAVREHMAAQPVTVAILAADPITGEGAVAYLGSRPDIKVLPREQRHEAEAVLVLVDRITDETLGWIERAAKSATHADVRFVLVGDGLRERDVLRTITRGLVSAIPRREAAFDRIAAALVDSRLGRLDLPAEAQHWLAKQIRSIQHDVLEPIGLTPSGLDAREVEVLRLLAEGLATGEIAERLKYSERTIKNIVHKILTRFDLHNRAHAVAFAVRAGAI